MKEVLVAHLILLAISIVYYISGLPLKQKKEVDNE